MEERPEALPQGVVGERLRQGLTSRLDLRIDPRLDQRIDGDRLVAADDQRVQVDALDLGALDGQPRKPFQHVGQGLPIDRRLAPMGSGEKRRGGQPIDHRPRFLATDRGDGKDDIAQGLGQDSTQAEQHAGPELRIAHHARDQLPLTHDPLGHQQRDLPVLGPRPGEQVLRGLLDRRRIRKADPHQPTLGLVCDAIAAKLQHDRIADLVGGPSRGLRILRLRLGREGNAEARDDRLGGVLRQGHGRVGEHGGGLGIGFLAAHGAQRLVEEADRHKTRSGLANPVASPRNRV